MIKFRSIRSKLVLSFVLINLIFIFISTIFAINSINRFHRQLIKQNFTRWATDFEAMAEPNFTYFNYMNLCSQSEEILKDKPKDFIFLFDSRDLLINFSGPEKIRQELNPLPLPKKIDSREIEIQSSPYYLISVPVLIAGSDTIWGHIVFGFSFEESQRLISRMTTILAIVAVGLLALALITIVLVTKRLTQPVEILKSGLEKISNGNFAYRIHLHSNDEFSFLGSQFNEMAEKIQVMMTEIEDSQRQLGNQVKARTRELDESNNKLQLAMQELRSTQQSIIQIEKQKSLTAIVSGFAHEINNPLTGILGYVDLMAIREDVTPYLKEKLLSIQKQALRIKNIIDQLSQLNPDSDQAKLDINLSNLLSKLIKIIVSKPENRNFLIEKEIPDEELMIFGNHFSLWQVFDGIIENAIESVKENNVQNGKVSVILKKSLDRQYAVVDIIDNGGGFKNIEKAFDPFYTTKSRTQKKGIGLSIAYNIIQEHHGKISIVNNDRNGATVCIYLKLTNENGRNE